jgi:hypothetical protein
MHFQVSSDFMPDPLSLCSVLIGPVARLAALLT